MGDVAFLDISGRVASKLAELADTKGRQTSDGIVIDLSFSQSVLAGMVGASRENVNRALSRLMALGAVSIDQGHITILDEARLRSLC